MLDFCRVILCGDYFTISSFGDFHEPSSAASAGPINGVATGLANRDAPSGAVDAAAAEALNHG